jgi:predicted O-methyltransferase YrrM
VETFQSQWELGQLVALVEHIRPKRVLEIGAWHGGTLREWLKLADDVVVVDDEMRMAEAWHDWADESLSTLTLLKGRSQDPQIIQAAQGFGPYDFLFIDGDHTYESVRSDWENYGHLAGVVAFHDILPRPGYGVSDLWRELTEAEGCRYVTICQNEVLPGFEGRCGVGVLWL